MEGKTRDLMNKSAPWSRDVRWPVVAIEAAVLIAIGGYMLIDADGASEIVLQLIGVVFLATSLVLGLANLRSPEAGLGFYDAFRAGVGATCGAIATASWWSDYIADHAVRIILGWGLLAYAVIHLVGQVVVRGRSDLRLSTIGIAALTLVLGIFLLTGDDSTADGRLRLLGVILLVFGVLLAAWAYYLYSRKDAPAASAAGSVTEP